MLSLEHELPEGWPLSSRMNQPFASSDVQPKIRKQRCTSAGHVQKFPLAGTDYASGRHQMGDGVIEGKGCRRPRDGASS